MKSALKLLVTFGVGCLIGIVLVCAGIVSFTDMTWNELVQKLAKIEALEMVGIFAGVSFVRWSPLFCKLFCMKEATCFSGCSPAIVSSLSVFSIGR